MTKSINTIAIDNPAYGYDRELTFVGVLRKFFVDRNAFGENIGLSRGWNADTTARYVSDYERRLIPLMNSLFGVEKPIHSYSEEDFDLILEKLRDKYRYDDSTLLHYRHLLWAVYSAGFEHNLYPDNIFWYELADPAEQSEEDREYHRANTMTRLRKSFSPDEEVLIAKWFLSLDPKTVSGEDIGVCLMFFLGVRNNEACGANFASFHELAGYINVPVFDMLQSTQLGNNQLKAGGKTENAPRILPLFSMVYDFIIARRNFLEGLISSGNLVLPPEIESVEKLPVVCDGHNYTKRANSNKLTLSCRHLFAEIGINKSTLAFLHQVLLGQEFKDNRIDEKEPTAYLNRRNCGTHLYRLGLSEAEIQYWLGHNIEDPSLSRSDFSDPGLIHDLALKLQKHPFNVLLNTCAEETPLLNDHQLENNVFSAAGTLSYKVKTFHHDFIVDLQTIEPFQPISVSIESNDTFKLEITVSAQKNESLATIDICGKQQEIYRNKMGKPE